MKKLTNKKRARLSKFALLFYIICVCYLCFAQFSGVEKAPQYLFGIESDKIAHFCMFFPFPILLYLCGKSLTRKPLKALFFALDALAIGAAFAAGTELIQRTIAYRTGDWRDFLADILALAIASGITLLTNYILLIKRASD